jgi:tRNA threonylcarbamoyladenosine biosynthesis protein TsaE
MQSLGEELAGRCPPGAVIYLSGPLGAGKTTLVRGFLRALGHTGAVRSPTYTLVEPYQTGPLAVWHLDLYRLADADELEYLGIREEVGTEVVFLIEWPERGREALPDPDVEILIDYLDGGRLVELRASSPLGNRLISDLT